MFRTALLVLITIAADPEAEDVSTEQIVDRSAPSVALIVGRHCTGSGFVVQPGVVATNRHVVQMELDGFMRVYFPPSGTKPLKTALLYEDQQNDLAFLVIDSNAQPLSISSDKFRPGRAVVAIGSPGLSNGKLPLSAINTGVITQETVVNGLPYWQLGLSVSHGNSGGPVLDGRGEVIGVATLKDATTDGISFCIPADELRAALKRLNGRTEKEIETERSQHQFKVLNRLVYAMTETYAQAMKMNVLGLRLAQTRPAKSTQSTLAQTNAAALAVCSKYDRGYLREVQFAATQSKHDPNISKEAREQFSQRWSLYTEFKSFVESPAGHLDYAGSYDRLSSQFSKLPKPD